MMYAKVGMLYMRVISGEKRGTKLFSLEGDNTRPTLDRVKESLFNIIQFDLVDSVFLDLFAGSGQIALEALSRGANSAVLVDSSAKAIAICKKNISATKFSDKAKVVNADYACFLLGNKQEYDIAFLDPPYNEGILQDVLPKLASFMKNEGIIICEHSLDDVLPETVEHFKKSKSYKYGKIMLTFYRD